MSGTLRLVEHDGEWASRFAAEAERIHGAIGAYLHAIEHVGSTAVPGLSGKPVLDVAVAVKSEQLADDCIAPLGALGYSYRDALRADPQLAIAYAAEKERVALAVGWDKTEYSISNGPFIQAVLRQLRDTDVLTSALERAHD